MEARVCAIILYFYKENQQQAITFLRIHPCQYFQLSNYEYWKSLYFHLWPGISCLFLFGSWGVCFFLLIFRFQLHEYSSKFLYPCDKDTFRLKYLLRNLSPANKFPASYSLAIFHILNIS